MVNNQERESLLIDWLKKNFTKDFKIIPIQNDASFRRYFRITNNDESLIAMDAPPERENLTPYIAVANAFAKKNLDVPEIIAFDKSLGFMLLSDLGDDQYFRIMTEANADSLYHFAMASLSQLQACRDFAKWQLPDYDERLLRNEMELFRVWYLEKRLSLILTKNEADLIEEVFLTLINSAKAQPQVCVHRDYHSRNLLRTPQNKVGILDFQDAVHGPLTYDLVSLLRDCYIAWPQSFVIKKVRQYQNLLKESSEISDIDDELFLQWFDWIGLQRHLKVLGIFVRLYLRDGKQIYLQDLPRVMSYVIFVAKRYPIFTDFLRFLELRVLPNESHDFSSRTWEAYATIDR